MQTYLSVNKKDLYNNAKSAADYVSVPVIAVVKCNGYGIGLENAVNAWYRSGVRTFAAAEPFEALQIAKMELPDIDILLLSPLYDGETIAKLSENNIIFTVTGADCAKRLADICLPLGAVPKAHIKVDTGMGRFGEKYDSFDKIREIYDVDGVDFCGIFTHFALSFEPEYNKTKIQLERFLSLTEKLQNDGIDVGVRHCANSCAALLYPQTRLDAVRLGSALVGRLMRSTPLKLTPVGKIYAPAADISCLKKGDTSGYAMIYKAKSDINCAVVEIGYRHGFGMTRKSDSFRFRDVLRDILHSIKGYGKPLFVYDESGKRHNAVGRIGNQYTLFDNSDGAIKPGDMLCADVNLLMIDSAIPRILE